VIAGLTGKLATVGPDHVVVQVGGIGFRLSVPQTLLESLPAPGREIALFTHLHVRETELALFGFRSEEELALFTLLLGVSGIGPKVALSILSSLPPDQLRAAVAREDIATLARVPGIGPKTARKLCFDLRDRMAAQLPSGALPPALTPADEDLIAALTGLGYSVVEAQEAMRALPQEPLSLEERVRLSLAYFAS
jgi:Holliday junction DNA helicase RuvA